MNVMRKRRHIIGTKKYSPAYPNFFISFVVSKKRRPKMFSNVMYSTLFVSDQDKALDFYTKLSFEKRADNPGPEGRFLRIGFKGQNLEVLLCPGTQGRANKEQRVGPLFAESDNLRKDFDALRSKGVRFVEAEPEDYPFGVRATALDPDGNAVCLRQRKGKL